MLAAGPQAPTWGAIQYITLRWSLLRLYHCILQLFAFDTVMAALSIVYVASFKVTDIWSLALTFPFVGIVVFRLSYGYYDRKED